jgi:hypothetical protein
MESEPTNSPSPKRQLSFISYVVTAIAIIGFGSTGYLYSTNEILLNSITQRDDQISAMQKNDSLYQASLNEYSKIISTNITDCKITVDNKKLSIDELAKLLNTLIEENRQLADTLYNTEMRMYQYRDTLIVKNKLLELAIEHYGIKISASRQNNKWVLIRSFSKADSARILFPFFRDRLKKDTLTNSWVVGIHKYQILPPKKKK